MCHYETPLGIVAGGLDLIGVLLYQFQFKAKDFCHVPPSGTVFSSYCPFVFLSCCLLFVLLHFLSFVSLHFRLFGFLYQGNPFHLTVWLPSRFSAKLKESCHISSNYSYHSKFIFLICTGRQNRPSSYGEAVPASEWVHVHWSESKSG